MLKKRDLKKNVDDFSNRKKSKSTKKKNNIDRTVNEIESLNKLC